MPGRPVRAKLLKDIEAAGDWEHAVFERIESGETMTKVAKSFGISLPMLSNTIREREDLVARLKVAKKRAAEALVDSAMDIVDDVPLDRDAIQKAKLQVELRTRLAGMFDREQFGETKPIAGTTINIGSLHIDALRKIPVAVALPEVVQEAVIESIEEPLALGSGDERASEQQTG